MKIFSEDGMIDDAVAAIFYLLENEHCNGAHNLVAPHQVTNQELTKILGKVLRSPRQIWQLRPIF